MLLLPKAFSIEIRNDFFSALVMFDWPERMKRCGELSEAAVACNEREVRAKHAMTRIVFIFLRILPTKE